MYTHVHIYKTLMPMLCQVTATNIFTFVNHMWSFIYDPTSILCLEFVFVFCKCIWSFSLICSLTSMTIYVYSLFGRHIAFSLCMPTTFKIIHICLSIHNTNAYEMLRYSYKYVHWQPYLFFHVYDHVFILWLKLTIVRNYILYACIDTYIHILMYADTQHNVM